MGYSSYPYLWPTSGSLLLLPAPNISMPVFWVACRWNQALCTFLFMGSFTHTTHLGFIHAALCVSRPSSPSLNTTPVGDVLSFVWSLSCWWTLGLFPNFCESFINFCKQAAPSVLPFFCSQQPPPCYSLSRLCPSPDVIPVHRKPHYHFSLFVSLHIT